MTCKSLSRFLGCLLSVLIIQNGLAQFKPIQANYSISKSNGPKYPASSSYSFNPPNSKLTSSFKREFPNVQEVRWSDLDGKHLAVFNTDGEETRSLFTKRGHFIYSNKYGTEKDLSPEIRKLVKSNYVEFGIMQVIEVKENLRDIWVIRLENPTSIVFVRVENGELEETDQFHKSN